jgi:glutaminase
MSTLEESLFKELDPQGEGRIRSDDLLRRLNDCGLRIDDARLQPLVTALEPQALPQELTLARLRELLQAGDPRVREALRGELVIPDFRAFCETIADIYRRTRAYTAGKVADYIPQLGRVAPENYGVAICTIDGQRFSMGDAAQPFSIQSISKPVNYCLALEERGEEGVHRHIGREPSGHGFNAITLDAMRRPHNPMINAGAIVSASLIRAELEPAERFDFVMGQWRRLCGGIEPRFNNAVYLSEKQTADRNFALAYFLRENKVFPPGTDLLRTLDFYFQCCSLELSAEALAVAAATLAQSGLCPLTGERVFGSSSVKHCLSLMDSCGLYDFSGEWAFTVGLPAKSGVGGGLLIVIPNVMGIGLWSPPLDALGNSVRGIEFCRELIRTFNFHNYDSLLTGQSEKIDPRLKPSVR